MDQFLQSDRIDICVLPPHSSNLFLSLCRWQFCNLEYLSYFVSCSLKGPPRASRHLTIFYGGQAHVFDDVPSDKVRFSCSLVNLVFGQGIYCVY